MRIFNIRFNHKKLFYIGLLLTAISLPLSKVALSISMIWLITNWLLEGEFKRKLNTILQNKPVLIFSGIFFIHLVWLFNTTDFSYAFLDIKNKAVLLLYPIIISTSDKLTKKQFKYLFILFSIALFISTLISTFVLVGVIDYPLSNFRSISVFISHIRLSLLINLCIYGLAYIIYKNEYSEVLFEKIAYGILLVWLVIFLFLLKSFTGIIIFFVLLFLVPGYLSYKIKSLIPRFFLQVLLICIFLIVSSYITHSISKFYSKEKIDIEKLETNTKSGNAYKHWTEKQQVENGNYVWINICYKEIEQEWNKLSAIPFQKKDKQGQEIQTTLIRYLTSKGYRKDSIGISRLTKKDIQNIESGMANYIFENKYAIYPHIYRVLWEIHVYKKGYNPSGNSVTQRFEFLKTASNLIQKNLWFGVGTGDVQKAFDAQYEIDNSPLPQNKRLRAHNQYVTFMLSFGIIGFCILFFCLLYPIFKLKAYANYMFVVFILIALISFINEDTLETHVGVAFFSYFYSLFLFGNHFLLKREKNNVQE